jgi:hypothetical protein
MNFNGEIAKELKNLNLGGEVIEIPKQDKATYEDYAKIEGEIEARCKANEEMMYESSKANMLPLG